jgi:hypothetical protein
MTMSSCFIDFSKLKIYNLTTREARTVERHISDDVRHFGNKLFYISDDNICCYNTETLEKKIIPTGVKINCFYKVKDSRIIKFTSYSTGDYEFDCVTMQLKRLNN